MRRRCTGTNAKGEPCGAAPLADGDLCFMHDPETADEAANARKLGGYRRKREGSIRAAYDFEGLNSPEDIRRLLEIAATDTLALDNGIARARVLVQLARAAWDLLEAEDFANRLARLEAAVLARPTPELPPGGLLD